MADYDPAWADAIKSIESAGSGGYDALGPVTASGDRAHGAYQVMGANVGPWTKAALGKEMTPDEFRADPDAQDAVFKHQFGASAEKYGNPQDAASVWFTGRPRGGSADSASDVLGTTGSGYVSKFNRALQDGPTAIQTAMGGSRSTGSKAMAFNGDDDETTPALSTAAALGPGALGAAPAEAAAPKNWLDLLGTTLMQMAPGVAQDPDHAKALVAAAAEANKATTAKGTGTWTTAYNPTTGVATQTNSLTGGTRQFQYAKPKPEKDPVQQAADIGRVKAMQDLSDTYSKNGADSRAALDTVGPIQAALQNPNVPQGFGGETRAQINKLQASLPNASEEAKKTASDTDVAVSGINKMVQEGRTLNGGMPGSLSDKDIVFLKQSQAGLGNTPEANQRIIDIYKNLHNRRVELDNASQAYQADTEAHPLGLDNGFKRQINAKWAAENAARDKALAASEAAAPATAPATPKLPKGVKSIQIIQ